MASRSITDADFYNYLIGKPVTAEWCGREVRGTVVDVEPVVGFNVQGIQIKIRIAEGGPMITVAPEDIVSSL